MFVKYNKQFQQTAADPALRRVAIVDFTRHRAVLFCCALVITGGAAVMVINIKHNPYSPALESLAAFFSWIAVVKISPKLQALKLLEQSYIRDAKPLA